MKILSTLASDMRGSIAGVTASRNRGGLYFRARRVPSKPNTPTQQAIKGSLSAAAAYWSGTLSAAEQAGWNLYGKTNPVKNNLGASIILSGSQIFNRINIPLIAAAGVAAVVATSPGAVPFLGAPQYGSATAVSITTGISAVLNVPANLTVGDYMFVYITRPNSVGRVSSHQPYRLAVAHKIVMMEAGMKTITITATDPFTGRPLNSQVGLKAVWISGANLSSYGIATFLASA